MLVLKTGLGRVYEDPKKVDVSASIRGLRRGDSTVLDRVGEESGEWYIQVWLRPDGPFQLEYRAGTAAEHYQTRTASIERVVDAFFRWIDRDPAWTAAFEWTNIGEWFEHHTDAADT